MEPILIISKGSISALGHQSDAIWEQYQSSSTAISTCCFNNEDTASAKLDAESELEIQNLRKEKVHYRRLDKSVLLAIHASRQALAGTGWKELEKVGINIGSSRGATQLFEKYHQQFISNPDQRMTPLVSPTTTSGNIASWVANDLGTNGGTLSHSITCSTALHSILNACAWINSGMAEQFIAGGSESPLTDFTVAQMKALGIYAKNGEAWPCSPLQKGNTTNTMVLGEGASVFAMEKDKGQKALASIIGIGYATEIIEHHASLSADGNCLEKSMRMALKESQEDSVDCILMHAPGTLQGDKSELIAIKNIFGNQLPQLISTKHQSGHTLGASGGISLDLAIEILNRNQGLIFPYPTETENSPTAPKSILVNAVGFGGNAVSIIIKKVR